MNQRQRGQDAFPRVLFKGVGIIVLAVMALVTALGCFTVIGAGNRGVLFSQFSGVQDTVLGEGLHFKLPFVHSVIEMDVRINKSETPASAASKDLQVVDSVIALNYHVLPEEAPSIYQEVGTSYKERIIDPAVQEAVKAVTAQYTAEELITKRNVVSAAIQELLTGRLIERDIVVDEFNIVEFNFSAVFNEAIEAKQTAEQNALKARQDLERIKIEAEQIIATATAEAESQRLQRETLTEEILQFRAIEKWDGKLPIVTGGAVPLIDLNSLPSR